MDSYFAPPLRTERRTLKNQIEFLANSPVMATLLKTAAGLLVVLNEERQIVALNLPFSTQSASPTRKRPLAFGSERVSVASTPTRNRAVAAPPHTVGPAVPPWP